MERVKRSEGSRRGREELIGGAHGVCVAMMLFCTILQWWIQVIIPLLKPTECTKPGVNSKVNYEL